MLTRQTENNRRTSCCGRGATVLALAVVLQFCVVGAAYCEERTQRRYDQIGGSPTASIFGVAQDQDGFLWVAIEGGGLARFDGREFRRWAPDKLTTHILFARSAGEPLALIVEPELGSPAGNSLSRIAGDTVEPIEAPGGQPWSGVKDAAYDERHRLWVARVNELFCRDGDHSEWNQIPVSLAPGVRIRRLAQNGHGGMFVVTSAGILSIDRDGVVSSIVKTAMAADAIDRGDGSILYAEMRQTGGGILELRDGRSTELLFLHGRFNRFVPRGRTIWAAFDSGVVALRIGEEPELLGPADGMPGGATFVDREGSLWAGTAGGLVQIPEPETVMWNQKDGLPLPSARYLAKTEEGVWISTWGGLCRLTSVGGKWKVIVDEVLDHKWPMMVDGDGKLWGKHRDAFLQRTGGRFKKYPVSDSGILGSIARASDGTLWIGTSRGLFKTKREESAPVRCGKPAGVEGIDQVLEDTRGELWVTSDNRICHAPAASVVSGSAAWDCEQIEGAPQFSRIVQTPGGEIWAGRRVGGGVWRYASGRWNPIPAAQGLTASGVFNIVPATSGGMWVLGAGFVMRVIERPDLHEGWEVVEELSVWQGVPATATSDLIEEADGSVWIATNAGVVRIRPDARRARPEAPPVKQTALMVNGRRLESSEALEFTSDGSQLELRFAALSFRSPGLVRYQHRLRPDDPWVDSRSLEAVFRFFDLRPGRYSAEVRASLDGNNWSPQPARVDFRVLGPWYFRWWAITAMFVLIGAALFGAHRARVAVLVRLERQRSVIAMDLHDEIGSGLGSIGILSGVAASESVKDEQRRELARNIVDTAAELGSALTDIVWSLHPDSASLEGLADRLTQRAYRLFPDGSPAFKTDFPQHWPRVDLSLAARHNLLLIGTEALHNAARHAKAQRVELGIAQAGSVWRFWVTDDGRGLGRNGQSHDHSGLGLITMRKRAEEIGAEINWSSGDGIGTTVSVIFSPASKDRRAK